MLAYLWIIISNYFLQNATILCNGTIYEDTNIRSISDTKQIQSMPQRK